MHCSVNQIRIIFRFFNLIFEYAYINIKGFPIKINCLVSVGLNQVREEIFNEGSLFKIKGGKNNFKV